MTAKIFWNKDYTIRCRNQWAKWKKEISLDTVYVIFLKKSDMWLYKRQGSILWLKKEGGGVDKLLISTLLTAKGNH